MENGNKKFLLVKKLSENSVIPNRSSKYAAGLDLFSPKDYLVKPNDQIIIYTDISLKIPFGYYGRIAGKSGLALKHKIDIKAGVIDNDYTGNIAVILANSSDEPFYINQGNRIAQLIIEKYCPNLEVIEVVRNVESERGNKGFGSTGS